MKRLELEADICEKTARKALTFGAESIRGRTGERIAAAAKRLGLTLPNASPEGADATR